MVLQPQELEWRRKYASGAAGVMEGAEVAVGLSLQIRSNSSSAYDNSDTALSYHNATPSVFQEQSRMDFSVRNSKAFPM